MKYLRMVLAVLLMIQAIPGSAQEDISGTWAGNLAVGPDTSLEILFVLTRQDDGSYTGVVTSTDPEGIQDMPATSVSFEGNQLMLSVEALSGRYEGTFADGGFSGNWVQPGGSIPLELAPYVEPTLSEADKHLLRGSWVGSLETPIGNYSIVFRFEDDDDGNLIGFLDSPDEGARGIPIEAIKFANGELEFRVPRAFLTYTATVTEGRFDGTWNQRGQEIPLAMTQGEYVPKGIELSDEAFSRIEGSWVGKVTSPAGAELNVVFRFEKTDAGDIVAFLDSPDQRTSDIPIADLKLDGDQLSLRVAAAGATYAGTVADGRIEGTWTNPAGGQPLNLTPGTYTPSVATLDLSDEAMAVLEGSWRGTMGPLEIVMRFERTPEGQPVAYLDVPAQGASGIPINEVTLADGQLSLTINAAGVNYTGPVDGATINGTWAQAGQNNPLVLTKD